jgi:hypothetical protein
MGHLGVVVPNVEIDQLLELREAFEGMQVQPLMTERTPECLDHGVAEADLHLGKHTADDAVGHQLVDSGIHVPVDPVGFVLLGMPSAAYGTHLRVKPKPGFEKCCHDFFFLIAPVSLGKSPIFSHLQAPLADALLAARELLPIAGLVINRVWGFPASRLDVLRC